MAKKTNGAYGDDLRKKFGLGDFENYTPASKQANNPRFGQGETYTKQPSLPKYEPISEDENKKWADELTNRYGLGKKKAELPKPKPITTGKPIQFTKPDDEKVLRKTNIELPKLNTKETVKSAVTLSADYDNDFMGMQERMTKDPNKVDYKVVPSKKASLPTARNRQPEGTELYDIKDVKTMTGDDGQQIEVKDDGKGGVLNFLGRNVAAGAVRSGYDLLATGADIGDQSLKNTAKDPLSQDRDKYLFNGKNSYSSVAHNYGVIQDMKNTERIESKFEKEYMEVINKKLGTETKEGLSGMKKVAEDLNPLDENSSMVERIVGGVAQSLPVMIASSLVGGQLVAGAGLITNASLGTRIGIQAISQVPFFTTAFTGSYQQARDMGLEGAEASKYGFLSAAIETGTENLFLPDGLRSLLKLPANASKDALKFTLKEFFKQAVAEGATEALNEPLQALMKQSVFNMEQDGSEVAKASFESFMAGALMAGMFNTGRLVQSGKSYTVKGQTEGGYIIETEDGQTGVVSEEVLVAYTMKQVEDERLQAIEEAAKLDAMEADTETTPEPTEINPEPISEPTVPVQEPTSPAEAFEPVQGTNTLAETKPVTEPLNEVVSVDDGVEAYYTQDRKLAFTDTEAFEKNYESAKRSIEKTLAENSTFEVVRDGVTAFTVHESNKKNGKYQITYYDKKGEPLSDSQVEAPELVKEVLMYKIRPSEMTAPTNEIAQPSADGTYTYAYRLRGMSPGAQPNGFVANSEQGGKFGTVTYDRPLTTKEISDYELNPVEAVKLKAQMPTLTKSETLQKQVEMPKPKRVEAKAITKDSTPQEKMIAFVKQQRKTELENIEKSNWDSEAKARQKLAVGMKSAAEMRKAVQGDGLEAVEGGLTDRERSLERKHRKSNYNHKPVITPEGNGIVAGMAFGKVKVELENGTVKMFMPDVVKGDEARMKASRERELQGYVDFVVDKTLTYEFKQDNSASKETGVTKVTAKEVRTEPKKEVTTMPNPELKVEKKVTMPIPRKATMLKVNQTMAKAEPVIEAKVKTDEGKLVANNMDIESDGKSFIRDNSERVEYQTIADIEYDNLVGTKESKTKATFMNSNMLSTKMMESAVASNPSRYRTTTNNKDAKLAYDKVMADYSGTYIEMMAKFKGNQLLSSEESITVDILLMRADELTENTGDDKYLDQGAELYNSFVQFRSKVGQVQQSFGMVKRMSRRGQEYMLEKSITNSRSQTQQNIATDFEALLDANLPDEAKIAPALEDFGTFIPDKGKKAQMPRLTKEGERQKQSITKEIDKVMKERKPRMPKPEAGPSRYETETITKLLDIMGKYGATKKWLGTIKIALETTDMTREQIVEAFYDEKARAYAERKLKRENAKPIPKFTDQAITDILASIKKMGVSKTFLKTIEADLQIQGLTKDEIMDRVYTEKGIPHMSLEDKAKLQYHLGEAVNLEDGSDEYNIHMNAVNDIIFQNTGGSIWRKVKSARIMSMLMNVKTPFRNEGGNWSTAIIFNPIESMVSFGVDKEIAKRTGTITTAPAGRLRDYNFIQQSKKDVSDFKNNVNSKSVEGKEGGGSGNTFKTDGVMGFFQKTTAFLMSDRRHYGSYLNQIDFRIEGAKQYARENGLEAIDGELEADFRDMMEAEAFENTFNNNSGMAMALSKTVRELNQLTPFIHNPDFGIGSILVPFAKTPMNLVDFMGRRIPIVSILPTIGTMLYQKQQGSSTVLKDNQRQLSKAIGKQASGLTLTAIGALMGSAGLITNGEDDDKVRKLLEAQGMTGSYLNMGAFKRLLTGQKASGYQNGDTLVSFSWAIPIAPFLLLGARFNQARTAEEGLGMLGTMYEVFGQSTGDFFEMPFARALNTLFDNKDMSGEEIPIGTRIAKVGTDLVTSIVPSLVKQTAQVFDPYSKKTAYIGKGSLTDAVKVSLPGLRNTLPTRYDIAGQPIEYFDPSIMSRIFNGYINPAFVKKVEVNDDINTILKALEAGDIDTLPVQKKNTFSIYNTETKISYGYTLDEKQTGYFQERYIHHLALTLNSEKATESAKNDVKAEYPNLKGVAKVTATK